MSGVGELVLDDQTAEPKLFSAGASAPRGRRARSTGSCRRTRWDPPDPFSTLGDMCWEALDELAAREVRAHLSSLRSTRFSSMGVVVTGTPLTYDT